MESTSVRRTLFSTSSFSNLRPGKAVEEQENNPELEFKEVEVNSARKESEHSENVDSFGEVLSSKMATTSGIHKDSGEKILIIGQEMAKELSAQLAVTCRVLDIDVTVCSANEILTYCNTERFVLIFVEMKNSEETIVPKICSSVRYNSNSLNRTVSIIGITSAEIQGQDFSSQGLNDVITLPLKEEDFNQLLLKWTGHTTCKGMPLTPESPEDDIVTARKAAEIIEETEEQSMLVAAHIQNCEQIRRDHEPSTRIDETNSCTSILQRPPQAIFADYSTQQHNLSGLLATSDNTNSRDHPLPTATTPQDLYKVANKDITRVSFSGPYPQRLGEPSMNHAPQGHFPGHLVQNTRPFPVHTPPAPMEQYPTGHHMDPRQFHVSPSMYQYGHATAVLPCRPVLHHPMVSSYGAVPVRSQERSVIKGNIIPPNVVSSASFQAPLARASNIGGSPAYIVSGTPGTKDMKITLVEDDLSKHSSKERIRRERIKESCDQLRFLLPNITGKKTDMASILEMTVKFMRFVNERIPPQVMQEIADKLAASTITSQSKKRAQKDLQNTKQSKLRLSSPPQIRDGIQRSLSIGSPLLPDDVYHMRTPTMVHSPGPVYLPHMHMGPGQHSLSHQAGYGYPIQASVVSRSGSCANLSKDIPYLTQTSVLNYGSAGGIPKEAQSHLRPTNENHGQVGGCPHRTLICGTPLSVNTTGSNEMPQQWNFLKLPPINTISPSNSSLDLSSSASTSSLDQESVESERLSSMESSPMWEEHS